MIPFLWPKKRLGKGVGTSAVSAAGGKGKKKKEWDSNRVDHCEEESFSFSGKGGKEKGKGKKPPAISNGGEGKETGERSLNNNTWKGEDTRYTLMNDAEGIGNGGGSEQEKLFRELERGKKGKKDSI